MKKEKAVCIISGGLDSITLLYWAKQKYQDIEAINFKYGAKHNDREATFADYHCKKLNIPLTHIELDFTKWGYKSALLKTGDKIPEGHYEDENMKQTVVPFRNGIMLSIAVGYAENIGAEYVMLGSHKGDRCLAENELIITKGGKKEIKQLQKGDEVLSQNLSTNKIEFKKILKVINNGLRDDVYLIETKGGRTIKATSNHKFFRINRSNFHQHIGWKKNIEEVPLSKLQVGDWLLSPKIGKYGEAGMVKIKNIMKCNSAIVYDVTVEDNHNFFAGQGGGLLVSNSIYPDCRSEFTQAISLASQLGTYKGIKIISPFNDLMKWEVLEIGLKLGIDYSKTWSCYNGLKRPCLKCGTCVERTEAFYKNNINDPLLSIEEWVNAVNYAVKTKAFSFVKK